MPFLVVTCAPRGQCRAHACSIPSSCVFVSQTGAHFVSLFFQTLPLLFSAIPSPSLPLNATRFPFSLSVSPHPSPFPRFPVPPFPSDCSIPLPLAVRFFFRHHFCAILFHRVFVPALHPGELGREHNVYGALHPKSAEPTFLHFRRRPLLFAECLPPTPSRPGTQCESTSHLFSFGKLFCSLGQIFGELQVSSVSSRDLEPIVSTSLPSACSDSLRRGALATPCLRPLKCAAQPF